MLRGIGSAIPKEGDPRQDGPHRLGFDPRISLFSLQAEAGQAGDNLSGDPAAHLLPLLPDLVDGADKFRHLILPPAALRTAIQLHVHLPESGLQQ